MEVLFHFIFQLFKIAIQAILYSLLINNISKIIQFVNPEFKIIKTVNAYFITYVLLLLFSFTYFGNHGLGDGPKIPIGNWKTIENTNWEDYCYLNNIENSDGQAIDLKKFLVKDNKLCGKYGGYFYTYKNDYITLDLYTNEIKEFEDGASYNNYAKVNNLPLAYELLSFSKNYTNHWGGIRFLLLP